MKKFLFLAPLLTSAMGSAIATSRRLGPTATYDLEWLRNQRNGRVLTSINATDLQRIVDTELAAHNARTQAMIGQYAARVPSRDGVDATGQSLTGSMTEVDEYGRARTQRPPQLGATYFPLRRYQFAAGFTADFFRKRTGADVVAVLENAQAAHRRELVKQIRDRIFSPFNYDFEDFLTDGKVFNVKAFYNNDGSVPPVSPNLTTFAGTHNHYLGFTALDGAAMQAMINGVREHSDGAEVEVHISAIDEATVVALPGFAVAQDVNVRVSVNQTVAVQTTDRSNLNSRYLGQYQGAAVYVKAWIFDHYGLAVDVSDPALGIRHPDDVQDEGLRPIGSIATFPLQSEYWGAEFGIGVRRRGGMVVAQFNSASAGQYTDPTGRSW